MVDAEGRAELVLRVWGSFIAGLLLFATVAGFYDYFAQGLVVTGPGILVVGFSMGLPFLVAAGVAAFFLAPTVVRRPALWCCGATLIVSSLCLMLFPYRWWIPASIVSAASSLVLCIWLARRPLSTI